MVGMSSHAYKPHSHGHDHATCITDALAATESHCHATGAKLTPIRRRVLELIWQSHKPAGAYDLLAQLGGDGRRSRRPLFIARWISWWSRGWCIGSKA